MSVTLLANVRVSTVLPGNRLRYCWVKTFDVAMSRKAVMKLSWPLAPPLPNRLWAIVPGLLLKMILSKVPLFWLST